MVLYRFLCLFFYSVTPFFYWTSPFVFQTPEPIDEATLKEAHSPTGFDENEYELVLVFLHEFEVEERTFWPVLFVLSFFSFLHFLFISSLFAVMTIQFHQDLHTASGFSRSYQLRHL